MEMIEITTFPSKQETHMEKLTKETEETASIPEENYELTFICFCFKKFSCPKILGHHVKEAHEIEKYFLCRFCDATFSCRSDLRNHDVEVHPPTDPSQCRKCFRYFASKRGLDEHSSLQHPTEQNSDKVEENPLKSESKESQAKFENVTLQKKTFHQRMLNRKLKKKQNFLENKSLTQTNNLKNGSESSNSAFSPEKSLPSQKKVGKLKRGPYKCKGCEKYFSCRGNLQKHSVVHSGARDFACPKCPKKFGVKQAMTEHVKSKHLRIRVKCKGCNQSFLWQSSLSLHMKKVHKKTKV